MLHDQSNVGSEIKFPSKETEDVMVNIRVRGNEIWYGVKVA